MSFPNYIQLDSMDCGPTCLRIIAAFYGRHYSLQNLRDRCHITREGVSLLGISDAAEGIGLRSVGVKLTWQQLRDEANFPCIVHWNQRHFVVVYKIEKKRGQWWVYVSDPAVGLLNIANDNFSNRGCRLEPKIPFCRATFPAIPRPKALPSCWSRNRSSMPRRAMRTND